MWGFRSDNGCWRFRRWQCPTSWRSPGRRFLMLAVVLVVVKGVGGNYGWDGMHPGLEIGEDDWMPDTQAEVFTICKERQITHLIYVGFHTQVCENQRGQASLLMPWGNRTRFRPRGRIVDSRLSRRAIDSTQPSSPSGLPRCVDNRTADNSFSVSGVLTRWVQLGCRAKGHGDSNSGLGSGLRSQRHSDPHCQSSARWTKPARKVLRSTYRHTTNKCSSSWIGNLLYRCW